MVCERWRRALVERHLGLLDAPGAVRLENHLEHCPGCRAREAEEAELDADLALLSGLETPTVSLAGRILSEVGSLPPGPDVLVPQRQIAWASAVCALFAVAVLAGGYLLLPLLPEAAMEAGGLLDLLDRGVQAALTLGGAILGAVFSLIRFLAGALLSVALAAGRFLPAAIYITMAAFAAVTVISTILVGRELRPSETVPRGEPR